MFPIRAGILCNISFLEIPFHPTFGCSLFPPPTPPMLLTGPGQSCVVMGWGKSLTSPRWLHLLLHGWVGTAVLSLVWLSLTGGHYTGTEDLCGHSKLSPTRQCPTTLASQFLPHIPEPCTEPLPGAGTIFPFLHLPIPGKAWSDYNLAFRAAIGSLLFTLSLSKPCSPSC